MKDKEEDTYRFWGSKVKVIVTYSAQSLLLRDELKVSDFETSYFILRLRVKGGKHLWF